LLLFHSNPLNPTTRFGQYLELLDDCLAERQTWVPNDNLDCRWFNIDDKKHGKCLLGLAREAITVFLRKCVNQKLFRGEEWLSALPRFKNNPPVLGSIVQERVISKIATHGLSLESGISLTLKPAEIIQFEALPIILADVPNAYYVPEFFAFKAIDFIYVSIDAKGMIITIVPAQTTIAKEHSDSFKKFFDVVWPKLFATLSSRFPDFRVAMCFVWITESNQIIETGEPAEPRLSSWDKFNKDNVDVCWVTIDRVDRQLRNELVAIRPTYNKQMVIREYDSCWPEINDI
jgi:hypothetical protein